MRKIWMGVVASCAVLALVPATAAAQRHHRSHGHHARVHHRTFGSDPATTQGQTGTQNTGTAGPAGTVQSFTGGVLTIALTNGSTVSGQVTNDTQIACESSQTSVGDSQDQSQSSGSDDNDDQSQSGNPGQGDDNNQGGGDDQGDDNGNGQMCSTSDLVAGAGVQDAVLDIGSAGPVWKFVDLVAPSSSTTPTSPSSGDD
jgi:hypothetical protein